MDTEKNLNIAFISPGYKPVPDVKGGAVEHLMTQIINQNEKNPCCFFHVFTISDININEKQYKYSKFYQIKNFRKTFFLRLFSFLINIFFELFFDGKYRYSYLGNQVVKKIKKNIDYIIVENDVNIFKQISNKIKEIPLIFHMHNDFDTLGEMQKNRKSMEFVVKNAREIWTVSNYLKKHLLSEFPNARIKVLENCIDKNRFGINNFSKENGEKFRKKFNISENTFVILYVGRILPQKGVLELILSMGLVPKDYDVKLVIVGDLNDAQKKYREKIILESQKLQNNVIFTSYISQYEIQNAYYSADVVAIPSQCHEAFCLVALEAMCNKKVCIASNSGALAEVLNENCAIMIDIGDSYIEDFAKGIISLYQNRALKKNMENNAILRSNIFPDESQYFDNFCKLLAEVNKFE